ncbi:hypothetical protein GT037_004912 [Alternaria burnsii]|uniref:Transcription factor domain-containing protein n=1 Tax=Alternaria burnsii TaxID=1187904 RepID=A0A8H7B3H1_9PLEO|nr:uncharacterized protein GT037_004912 [Alternaria burnsii]KAF7676700.1 hypothetical protein GT037_004912 [Alternaria burnsii]
MLATPCLSMKTDDLSLQRSIESAQPSIDHGRDEDPATTRSSQEPAIELPLTPPTARQSPYAHIKDAQLPDSVISEGIALYFSEFCNQPCPILASSQTLESSEDDLLPPMILYAMLALSLRSSRHPFLSNRSERMRCIARMTKLSWNLIAKAYCDFAIDDVYFQALCLQVQVDSGDGRLERARAQVALGLRVAQARDMLSADSLCGPELADRARRQEIIWSLFMLDRMLLGGNTRNPSTPTTAFELPVIQSGPFHPDIRTQPPEHDISLQCVDSDAPLPPQSVTCLQIQTIRIWECVIDYIAQPPSDTDVPLWRHDSPRAAILTKLLDIEMRSPARVLDEPHLKNYFVVWLRFQLTLSVVNCTLNHPFMIHIKTVRLKQKIPLTFLQKSYEFSLIHANWVVRLLSHMDEAKLMLHDPFLGHLVAIAASIHLEHTKSQYPTVAASAKQKFEKCLDFVKRLSQEWPRMQVSASLLEQLKARIPYRSILNYIEEEYDGAAPPEGANQVHLEEEDLLLLWRLFDYTLTSPKSNSECAFDEQSNTAMHSVPPLFNASSNFANNQSSINPSPSSSAGMLIQTTSAGLEDIAFQAYGDTSVSGGTAFNYFPDDIDSLHPQ